MTIDMLKLYLKQNRELEIVLNGKEYFIATTCKGHIITKPIYFIYDCTAKKNLFKGSRKDLLNYQFPGNLSLNENLSLFEFKYIL